MALSDQSERPVGRCIGCRSRDYPYCRGCGADLSTEKKEGGGRHPEGPLPDDYKGFNQAVLRHMARRPR